MSIRREKFKPSLDSRIVFTNLDEAFECLVVQKNAEGGTPRITTEEALDARHDAATLEIKCRPAALGLESSAAVEHYRAHRAVFLFLPECGFKPIDASITIKEERVENVGYRTPIQVDQDQRHGEVLAEFRTMASIAGRCKNAPHSLPQK